jgi:hypothetical protein
MVSLERKAYRLSSKPETIVQNGIARIVPFVLPVKARVLSIEESSEVNEADKLLLPNESHTIARKAQVLEKAELTRKKAADREQRQTLYQAEVEPLSLMQLAAGYTGNAELLRLIELFELSGDTKTSCSSLFKIAEQLRQEATEFSIQSLERVILSLLETMLNKLPASESRSLFLNLEQIENLLKIYCYQKREFRITASSIRNLIIEKYEEFFEKYRYLTKTEGKVHLSKLWDVLSYFELSDLSLQQHEYLTDLMIFHGDVKHPLATRLLLNLPVESAVYQEQIEKTIYLQQQCEGNSDKVLEFISSEQGRILISELITAFPSGFPDKTLGIEIEHWPQVLGIPLPKGFTLGVDDNGQTPEMVRLKKSIAFNTHWMAQWADLHHWFNLSGGLKFSLHLHTSHAETVDEQFRQHLLLKLLFIHDSSFDDSFITPGSQDVKVNHDHGTFELRLPLSDYPEGDRQHALSFDSDFLNLYVTLVHYGGQSLHYDSGLSDKPKRLEVIVRTCSDPKVRAAAAVLFGQTIGRKGELADAVIPRKGRMVRGAMNSRLEYLPNEIQESCSVLAVQEFWKEVEFEKTQNQGQIDLVTANSLLQQFKHSLKFWPDFMRKEAFQLLIELATSNPKKPIQYRLKVFALCLDNHEIFSTEELKDIFIKIQKIATEDEHYCEPASGLLISHIGLLTEIGIYDSQDELYRYISDLETVVEKISAKISPRYAKNERRARFFDITPNILDDVYKIGGLAEVEKLANIFDVDLDHLSELDLIDLGGIWSHVGLKQTPPTEAVTVFFDKILTKPGIGRNVFLKFLTILPLCSDSVKHIAQASLFPESKMSEGLCHETHTLLFHQHYWLEKSFGKDLMKSLKVLTKNHMHSQGEHALNMIDTIWYVYSSEIMQDPAWFQVYRDIVSLAHVPLYLSKNYVNRLHRVVNEYRGGNPVIEGISQSQIETLFEEAKSLPAYSSQQYIFAELENNQDWKLAY